MKNGARPKVNRQRTHKMYSSEQNEAKADKLHSLIAEFEDYKSTILPALQKDIKSGMTAAEIREKYAAIVQARLITDALANPDAGKAAMIGKDILDRAEGKATERQEITHKFEDMNDEEIDAILKSEIEELEELENRFQ